MTKEDQRAPVAELVGAPIATHNSRGNDKIYLSVVHRGNTATIIAFDAETLGPVGHMIWTINKPGGRSCNGATSGIPVGEIVSIWVQELRRGKGIGTCMYREARQVARARGWPAEIDHNRERTNEGERWAQQAPSGYIPARQAVNSEDTVARLLEGLQP